MSDGSGRDINDRDGRAIKLMLGFSLVGTVLVLLATAWLFVDLWNLYASMAS
ncbi:MAG: hypothetical protein GY788_08805 [bacterium]|nr:hypothetical protein [bacterium]